MPAKTIARRRSGYPLRKKRRYGDVIPQQKILAGIAAAAALAVLLLCVKSLMAANGKGTFRQADVAAFQIPYKSFQSTLSTSDKYGLNKAEFLTLYCFDNKFFPGKSAPSTQEEIEQAYIIHYDALCQRYGTGKMKPYADMFAALLEEMRCFPLAGGDSGEASYMYGESWGADCGTEGQPKHQGLDIVDRDNLSGSISIYSMTDGTMESAGWDSKLGYRAIIRTGAGTRYLYAHLSDLAAEAVPGAKITAGQVLGHMGNSGFGQKEGAVDDKNKIQLHIGISPKTSFAKDPFWINPYPFLRQLEDSQAMPPAK